MIQKQHKRQGRTPQSDDLPFQVGQSEFGVGAPPILVYFSGDWDARRVHGLVV